jgi:hypothetical protein
MTLPVAIQDLSEQLVLYPFHRPLRILLQYSFAFIDEVSLILRHSPFGLQQEPIFGFGPTIVAQEPTLQEAEPSGVCVHIEPLIVLHSY